MQKMISENLQQFEEELFSRMLEEAPPERLLRVLGPEERLRGLEPEEILGALTPEKILGALTPEKILGALTPEKLAASRTASGKAREVSPQLIRPAAAANPRPPTESKRNWRSANRRFSSIAWSHPALDRPFSAAMAPSSTPAPTSFAQLRQLHYRRGNATCQEFG